LKNSINVQRYEGQENSGGKGQKRFGETVRGGLVCRGSSGKRLWRLRKREGEKKKTSGL